MARFKKQNFQWKVDYYAITYTMDGQRRVLRGSFEGHGEDLVKRCQLELNYRLRKPYLWYGVGIFISTPLGQKIERIIEERRDGYGIILV